MTAEIKAIVIGILVLALVCGGYWAYRSAYDSGVTAGKAQVQSAWDLDKENIQDAADAALLKATQDKAAAVANNEAIQNDLQAELSSARALATTYAGELRDARTRLAARRGAVPQAANNPGAPSGSAPPSVGQLDAATGAALSECAEVRADYKSLIAEVTPQL